MEFAAMARELCGKRTMAFVARDGLPLFLVLDYLAASEDPAPTTRVAAFSGNAAAEHPLLDAYFRSQGLGPDDIGQRRMGFDGQRLSREAKYCRFSRCLIAARDRSEGE